MDLNKWRLYLVTEQTLSNGRTTPEVVKEAIYGGIDVIQLREKNLSKRKKYQIGLKIKQLIKNKNVDLIVNDDIDIALALDSKGVHLGSSDLPIKIARKLLGKNKIIGKSSYNLNEARKAVKNGADYLGFGAVFNTKSKKLSQERLAVGLKQLKKVSNSVSIPVVAIGGIKSTNMINVFKNGASSVALITEITQAENIKKKVEELKNIINNNLLNEGGI